MSSRAETPVSITTPSIGLTSVLGWATLLLTGLIFFLISLGGLVRNAGAGLACPDWPLCYGQVVPPMNYQIFLEWFHRLIAGSVSTLLLAVSTIVFFKSELRRRFGKYCVAALVLLMAQVVLGGLTVLGLLSPKWVSSHLAVGLLFFGTNLTLALAVQDYKNGRLAAVAPLLSSGLQRFALFAIAALYGQILLGGLVSSNYAGLACDGFPTCNGQWLPPFEGLIRFQVLHRLGAAFATVALVALLVASMRKNLSPRARSTRAVLPFLLVFQLFLGVGSVLLRLPLPMSVAHLGTAAALFGMLLVMSYEIRRSS